MAYQRTLSLDARTQNSKNDAYTRVATADAPVQARRTKANTTQRAAVVEKCGKPLVLREPGVLSLGLGQRVVKTEDCGVRGTDGTLARALEIRQ